LVRNNYCVNCYCLKKLSIYCIAILFAQAANGQYYLRGEIKSDKKMPLQNVSKSDKKMPLQNVSIFLHSSKQLFHSGSYGSFGFTVAKAYDSLTLSLEGYESKSVYVKTSDWQNFVLKSTSDAATKSKQKLISLTKNQSQNTRNDWFTRNETYFQLIENDQVVTAKFPTTGFSLNINTASYLFFKYKYSFLQQCSAIYKYAEQSAARCSKS